MSARGIVHGLQGDARLYGERTIHRIEIEYAIHPFQAQHQLTVGRHRAAG